MVALVLCFGVLIAVAGVFLAFQYPVEIPGVGNMTFLRTALNAQRKARGEDERSAADFLKIIREKAIQRRLLETCLNISREAYENKLEAKELLDNAERWFRDFGMDALRLDAIHALVDDFFDWSDLRAANTRRERLRRNLAWTRAGLEERFAKRAG